MSQWASVAESIYREKSAHTDEAADLRRPELKSIFSDTHEKFPDLDTEESLTGSLSTGRNRVSSTEFADLEERSWEQSQPFYDDLELTKGRGLVITPRQLSPPFAKSPFVDILRENEPLEGLEPDPEMLLQPDTRPISHEELVVEVKGIYAGLVMVEAKCIDIDERQAAAAQEKDPRKRVNLINEQWQSLIALHKQLLDEHHDFFLSSQHPSASQALSTLVAKY